MKAASKLSRLVLVSPWFLLIFTIIPLLVILSVTLHLRLPLAGSTWPLLFNNACFALLVAVRFLHYVSGIKKTFRYDAGYGKPREGITVPLTVAQVQGALEPAGFFFAVGGSYGEKRDLGHLGVMLLYGGLLIVLSFGTWDNLRQFSGTLLDAKGPATKLNRIESYRDLIVGPLAARPDSLPRMQIVEQFMPSRTYPHGATEIVLISADGKVRSKIVKPLEPFSYGGYDILMAKFIIEPMITIRTRDSKPVFEGLVKLFPVLRKEGAYGFTGPFQGSNVAGHVHYRTDTNRLKVVMNRDGKWVFDADLKFQVDQVASQGDYTFSCDKMGYWTEIHVVRRRHMAMLVIGGVIAAIGLLMRIAIRPQRVWIEDAAEGCRVWMVGRETKRLLRA